MFNTINEMEDMVRSNLCYDVLASHMVDRGLDPASCTLRDVLPSITKLVDGSFNRARSSMRKGGYIIVEGPMDDPQLLYAVDAGARSTLDRDMGFIHELHEEFRMELIENGIWSAKLDLDWTVEVYGQEFPVMAFTIDIHEDERLKLIKYLDLCENISRHKDYRILMSLDSGWRIHDWRWRVEDYDE